MRWSAVLVSAALGAFAAGSADAQPMQISPPVARPPASIPAKPAQKPKAAQQTKPAQSRTKSVQRPA